MEKEMNLLNLNYEKTMMLIENEFLALKKLRKMGWIERFAYRFALLKLFFRKDQYGSSKEHYYMVKEILLVLKDEGYLIHKAIKDARRVTKNPSEENLLVITEQLEMIKSKKQIRITYFQKRADNLKRRQLIRKSIGQKTKTLKKQREVYISG